MLFFFFKHKTAYELRISDWLSDVCSSDLQSSPEHACSPPVAPSARRPSPAGPAPDRRSAPGAAAVHHRPSTTQRRPWPRSQCAPDRRRWRRTPRLQPDRKRVVLGKSLSVRVDLGVRRSIKKKKQQTKKTNHHRNKKTS